MGRSGRDSPAGQSGEPEGKTAPDHSLRPTGIGSQTGSARIPAAQTAYRPALHASRVHGGGDYSLRELPHVAGRAGGPERDFAGIAPRGPLPLPGDSPADQRHLRQSAAHRVCHGKPGGHRGDAGRSHHRYEVRVSWQAAFSRRRGLPRTGDDAVILLVTYPKSPYPKEWTGNRDVTPQFYG